MQAQATYSTPPLPHHVRIEKVIAGGKGLARTAVGQVIMSGFVLPGETVCLREVCRKTGYIEAELEEVLAPSAARIEPPCPHYCRCGGCDLQHGSYAEQLRLKQVIVAEAIQRAHVKLPAAGVEETLPSPQQWGYRHRLRLKLSQEGRLGFFRKRSHAFTAIERCPAAADGINIALAELAASGSLRPLVGICQEAELHCSPADQRITLVLPVKGRIPEAAVQHLSVCRSISQIGCTDGQGFRHLAGTEEPLAQQVLLTDLTCTLSWSGGCFSQVNPGQNAQLIQLVLEAAGPLAGRNILDLYCGMGNFSVPLALAGGKVFGVEGNQESVRWAGRNAAAAGAAARFLAADVHVGLRQMIKERQRADIILLDPPRAGIGSTAALLPELRPERIICIACDPVTLARDLAILGGKGFFAERLIPLDMFPQTSHIETIAVLGRSQG
jgi:23S rRNA (uracil1939-C5)-methyltransferase